MTTFGEISEPWSRNIWEDWDDINQTGTDAQFHWDMELNKPDAVEKLTILEGKYLCDLVHHNKSLELVNSITKINMHLYKVKTTNNYICLLKSYDLVLSNEIIDLLKIYIVLSDEVLTIITKPLAEYNSSGDDLQEFIIRRLSTKSDSKSMAMKYLKLEQPNIISGVSAGAICLREVLNLPASAIIFYTEHFRINEVYTELHNILQKTNITIDKWKSNSLIDSNLYV